TAGGSPSGGPTGTPGRPGSPARAAARSVAGARSAAAGAPTTANATSTAADATATPRHRRCGPPRRPMVPLVPLIAVDSPDAQARARMDARGSLGVPSPAWHPLPVRFSIWPAATQPYTDLLAVARHAADTGWDGVWIADHFMGSGGPGFPAEAPTLEAGSLVAALAATVPRVRIGTLVYGNTYRHPAVVANMAATVDQISVGRFVLGLGAGWQENEHRQYGIELPPVGERVDRFEEAVQVIRSLLSEPVTTFVGAHYRLTDAVCEPKPVQDPLPVLIGASG